VVKYAPLFIFIAFNAGLAVMHWHLQERMNIIQKQSEFFEKQYNIAQSGIQKLVIDKMPLAMPAENAQPICVSKEDMLTEGTATQILIYNEVLQAKHGGKYDCKAAKWIKSAKP